MFERTKGYTNLVSGVERPFPEPGAGEDSNQSLRLPAVSLNVCSHVLNANIILFNAIFRSAERPQFFVNLMNRSYCTHGPLPWLFHVYARSSFET